LLVRQLSAEIVELLPDCTDPFRGAQSKRPGDTMPVPRRVKQGDPAPKIQFLVYREVADHAAALAAIPTNPKYDKSMTTAF